MTRRARKSASANSASVPEAQQIFPIRFGKTVQPRILLAGLWKFVSIFDHLVRRNLGHVDPDIAALDLSDRHHAIANLDEQKLLTLIATSGTNVSVHEYLLFAKRATTDKVIARHNLIDDDLREKALRPCRFIVGARDSLCQPEFLIGGQASLRNIDNVSRHFTRPEC
ncbi:protein of unknown function (plasmid) [Pararobbsia alpina]